MSEMLLKLGPNFLAGVIFPLAKKKKKEIVWRCFFAFILYYILWDFSASFPLMLGLAFKHIEILL